MSAFTRPSAVTSAFAASGGFTAVTLACSVIRSKGLAVILGPAGFGEWSQVLSLFLLLQTAATLGVTGGVARFTAERARCGQPTAPVVFTALLWVGGFALLLALTTVVLASWLAQLAVGRSEWWWVIALGALAAPLVAAHAIFLSGLQGLGAYRSLAWAGVKGALAGLGVGLVAALWVGSAGVAAFMVGSFAANAWFFGRALVMQPGFYGPWQPEGTLIRPLLGYGGATLVTAIFSSAASFSGRAWLVSASGADAAGLYQAMSGLTLQILPMFLNGAALYAAPRLAGTSDAGMASRVVTAVWLVVAMVVVPPLALALIFREAFFSILFSGAFRPAAGVFPLQLTGDLLMSFCWATACYLLPSGRLRSFIFCETARCVTYVATAAALLAVWSGPGALALAHALSYALELLLFLAVARHHGLLLRDRYTLLVGSLIAWACMVVATYTLTLAWRVVALFVVMGAFFGWMAAKRSVIAVRAATATEP